jgi:hypothetical protein
MYGPPLLRKRNVRMSQVGLRKCIRPLLELVSLAVETYKEHTEEKDSNGNKGAPTELFIHGKVRFDDEE